jgi:hypothetical protein
LRVRHVEALAAGDGTELARLADEYQELGYEGLAAHARFAAG